MCTRSYCPTPIVATSPSHAGVKLFGPRHLGNDRVHDSVRDDSARDDSVRDDSARDDLVRDEHGDHEETQRKTADDDAEPRAAASELSRCRYPLQRDPTTRDRGRRRQWIRDEREQREVSGRDRVAIAIHREQVVEVVIRARRPTHPRANRRLPGRGTVLGPRGSIPPAQARGLLRIGIPAGRRCRVRSPCGHTELLRLERATP
jgi:hypothetical protein